MTTRNPSKLIPAMLLGAGVLCFGAMAALAGDKIAYSWSNSGSNQKTQDMLKPVIPDDQPDDLSFHHSSTDPVVDTSFFMPDTSSSILIIANARNKKQNGHNGKSDPLSGNQRQDSAWGRSDDQSDDDQNNQNASNSRRGTNGLSSISMTSAWDPAASEQSDTDNTKQKFGLDNSRMTSDVFGKRDRQSDSHSDSQYGSSSGRDWSGQSSTLGAGSFPTRSSIMDILRDRPSYGASLDAYKSSQGADAAPSYSQQASTYSSGYSAGGSSAGDDSSPSFSSSYSSLSSSSRPSDGYQYSVPAPSSWSAPAGADAGGFQSAPSPTYSAPPPAYSTPPAYQTTLPMPRMPGSIGGFN